ncbi:MAG TPA: type II secretion system protein M [Woeseiaceae bacterium]|jgi:general secretion pathway protein M
MRSWFESLEERERLFVMAAAILLVMAVFYLAVWMPLDRGQKSLASSVDSWRSSLAELRVLKGSLATPGADSSRPADVNQSLVVIIDNTLRERALYNSLQRSQPTATNGIRVEFENVAFDDLVLWLGDLSSRYGLQVQSASFSAASRENDGRVNSTLSLER